MESLAWNEVAARTADDDRGKWDRKIAATQLRMSDGGERLAMTGGPTRDTFSLSDLATGQICERLAIPAVYYRRLPAEMKATVANFDLDRLRDRQFLLRGKATHVRAFLSGDYVAFNNRDIAETVERGRGGPTILGGERRALTGRRPRTPPPQSNRGVLPTRPPMSPLATGCPSRAGAC